MKVEIGIITHQHLILYSKLAMFIIPLSLQKRKYAQ